MVFSASTYYLVATIQFDITASIWFLPHLAGTAAPSVSQILTSGQNFTCLGGASCRAVIRGLQPLTQYDVYYWFRSEAGAEPLSSVSEMVRRLWTIDLVPFDLVVEAAGADYKTVAVVVSNEQRGGYVWCMVGETDVVPSVAQLKTTDPLVLEEGQERGKMIIPNLLPDTQYFGYCYVEDFYGDTAANSIASTRFAVQTLPDEPSWTLRLNATMTHVLVDLAINRAGELCCQLDLATESDALLAETEEVCGAVASGEPASLLLPAEDDREYAVRCVMHTTSLLDLLLTNASHVVRTPSRPPEFVFLEPAPRYNAVLLSLLSDRSAFLWCLVVEPSYAGVPSVGDMKTGQRFTVARDALNELLVGGLQPVTTYRLWCYGETFEGLPMVNPRENLTWVVETLPVPPSLAVVSVSPSATSVRLSVAPSIPATVRCLAQSPEAPTPSAAAFFGSEGVQVETLGEVVVAGLAEDTDYAAFCMAWDAFGQPMTTPVAATRQLFRTPLDRHLLLVSFVTMEQLSATISVVASADATAWCLPVHANDVVPTAGTLQAAGQNLTLAANEPAQLTFEGLEPDYAYAAYCYSESERGLGQQEPIAATRVTFHSLNYPVLELAVAAVSSKTLEVDVTSSTNGTVVCRARAQEPNALPPSEEWIQGGQLLAVAQPAIVNYLTVQGLQPATAYQLFCLARNGEGLAGLQSLAERSLAATTAADVVGPAVLFSTDPDEYTLDAQPVNVTVQFSETVRSFDVADLLLENCRILAHQAVTSQLSFLSVAPLAHGIFSLTLPAGKVLDLAGNGNSQQVLARAYPEGVLSASLRAVEPLFAELEVQYSYPANVSCVALRSADPPASCAALQASPGAAWAEVAGGDASATLLLENIAVNSTFFAYCCAEEANAVVSGAIGSTEVRIVVDWLDCPRNGSLVCSGQGACRDGRSCDCAQGFYGAACEAACPGRLALFADGADGADGGAVECRGHGVCQADSLACVCEEGFRGPDCAAALLEGAVPAEGFRFVYATLRIDASELRPDAFAAQEAQLALLDALAAQLGLDRAQTRVERWDAAPRGAARRLAGDTPVNATCVLNVAEAEAAAAEQSLREPTMGSRLSEALRAGGVANEGVAVAQVIVLSPAATDPYTCYDGALSEGESDVDCGGVCLAKCGEGRSCAADADCAAQLCEDGRCAKPGLGAGWIAVTVLLCAVLVCIVVLLALMVVARRHEKRKGKAAQETLDMMLLKLQRELAQIDDEDYKEREARQKEIDALRAKLENIKRRKQLQRGGAAAAMENDEEAALRRAEDGEALQRVIEMTHVSGDGRGEAGNAPADQSVPASGSAPTHSVEMVQVAQNVQAAQPTEPAESGAANEPIQPVDPAKQGNDQSSP